MAPPLMMASCSWHEIQLLRESDKNKTIGNQHEDIFITVTHPCAPTQNTTSGFDTQITKQRKYLELGFNFFGHALEITIIM
jgi:hypothetical protein